MKLPNRIWLTAAALAVATFTGSLGPGMAAEKNAIDPAGTWKIARFNPDTKAKTGSEETLKLRWAGGKLTGSLTGRSNSNGKVKIFEWAIKDTKLEGGNISFTVTHPPVLGQGPDSTTAYQGKITGDVMRGKLESDWSGQTFKRDWEAKRVPR